MESRHGMIPYALEETPRPGSREIRVRPVPGGMMIRSERSGRNGQSQGQ